MPNRAVYSADIPILMALLDLNKTVHFSEIPKSHTPPYASPHIIQNGMEKQTNQTNAQPQHPILVNTFCCMRRTGTQRWSRTVKPMNYMTELM